MGVSGRRARWCPPPRRYRPAEKRAFLIKIPAPIPSVDVNALESPYARVGLQVDLRGRFEHKRQHFHQFRTTASQSE
jgi:hypothetical protein